MKQQPSYTQKALVILGFLGIFCIAAVAQSPVYFDSLEAAYKSNSYKKQDELKILRSLAQQNTDLQKKLVFSDALIRAARAADSGRQLFAGFLEKGKAFKFKGEPGHALESFLAAAEVATDQQQLGTVYITIADVYSNMGNHANADTYYQKAILIMRAIRDTGRLAAALYNAGDGYLKVNQLDYALAYTNEARALFAALHDSTSEAYCLGNIGKIYARRGDNAKAEQNLNAAIEVLQPSGEFSAICEYQLDMADIYLQKGAIAAAQNYAQKSLALAQQYGLKDEISNASLKLSELYAAAGDYRQSLDYFKAHIHYRDSVRNLATVQQMANLRTDFEVSKKQKEVDVLATRNRLKTAERNGFIYVSVLLAALFATGVYFYRQNVRRNKIIAAQKQELDALNAAKDKLFSIVSHDLRSSVNALKSGSAQLTRHLADNNMAQLEQLVQNNSAVAHSTYNLLDNLLNWALLQTGQAYFQQAPLQLHILVEHTAFNYKPLMLEKHIAFENRVGKNVSVYADQESLKIILRNLLDNAIKFSPANGAITVYDRPATGNFCAWVVEDTGPGMPAAIRQHLMNDSLLPAKKAHEEEVGTGLGLQLVKSFIRKNGGQLFIENGEPTGTRIVIYLLKTGPEG